MSIEHYNINAEAFIADTFTRDLSTIADFYLSYIPEGGTLLDLGCGSGRDSIYFRDKGYDVYAVDGSEAMVEHARKYLGDRVTLTTFESYETNRQYDGIWALASLLHVHADQMVAIVSKYMEMLKSEGIFLMSFKEKENNYTKGLRNFTCYTKPQLISMLDEVGGVKIIEIIQTQDVREGREDESWLTAIVKKI